MAYTNIYYHVGSICASLASSTRSRRFFCPLPSTLGHTQKQNYVNRRRLSLGVFHFDIVALGPEPQRPQFDCCVAYRELAQRAPTLHISCLFSLSWVLHYILHTHTDICISCLSCEWNWNTAFLCYYILLSLPSSLPPNSPLFLWNLTK